GARLRVPAFDPKTWRYSWRDVSHVIRHRRANEVLEFRTESGKSVRVTGCHSLFTYDPATRNVREVEARALRVGDYIVAPRRLPQPRLVARINILREMPAQVSNAGAYVYGIPFDALRELRARASVVHAKPDGKRSRRYYRFRSRGTARDILDDSWSQYESRGFLPIGLVKWFGLELACAQGYLRTYHH